MKKPSQPSNNGAVSRSRASPTGPTWQLGGQPPVTKVTKPTKLRRRRVK
jgi:hypothetical protein